MTNKTMTWWGRMRNTKPVRTSPETADQLAACIETAASRQDRLNRITAMRLTAHHVRALAEAAEKAGLAVQINWIRE